jgi:DNA-directed RNA polymerase subunit RPC12/RpoP
VLRIYADFNGLVRGVRDRARTAVVLDTFGSMRDLSNAGVILDEGLPLIAVDWSDDDEDLEGHGTAQFDDERGAWVVEFDDAGVRYVRATNRAPVREFRCITCRADLGADGGAQHVAGRLVCPRCGGWLDLPLQPPARVSR